MDSVMVQGVRVAFERRGSGRPVALIHGWQGDHRYMAADLEAVLAEAGDWQRIYLDLPGHGQTAAPLWLGTQAQVLAILAEALEAITDGRPFAVAGNSYGGYLTLGLVRSIPDRLLGAALLVPDLPATDGPRDTPPHVTLVEDPEAFDDLAEDETWIPDRLVEQSRRAVLEIREHDMPSIRAADQAFLVRLESNYLLPDALRTSGAPFRRPSLVLTGRQDATVGYEAAWQLRDEFPRATIATLDLAGHWLGRVERPRLFYGLIHDWLDRIRTGAVADPPASSIDPG